MLSSQLVLLPPKLPKRIDYGCFSCLLAENLMKIYVIYTSYCKQITSLSALIFLGHLFEMLPAVEIIEPSDVYWIIVLTRLSVSLIFDEIWS